MYKIRKDGDWYCIEKNSQPLATPMGQPVKTQHKALAERLVAHLEEFGESPSNPVSIVAFHYAMIDMHSRLPRETLEADIANGFDIDLDWTFSCPSATPGPMMEWMSTFGTATTNAEAGREWASTLSRCQLCAACVLGAAMESVNIPFIVSAMRDPQEIAEYAERVCRYYPYVGPEELARNFENFVFYYTLDEKTEEPEAQPPRKRSRPAKPKS